MSIKNDYQDIFLFKDLSLTKDIQEKKIQILVVDDLRVTHDLVKYSLDENGFPRYELLSARNGQEGCDLALSKFPDVILMDALMPIMNGFEACRVIKSNKKLAHIPIVMLTTLDDVQSRIRALKAGADDFLTKPFNAYELIARINSLIRLKRYYEKLIYQNHSYNQELQVARHIQESILPKSSYKSGLVQFEFKSIPCLQVGGDYFNFYQYDEHKIAFFIADVVGHGVAPSLITMALKIYFDQYAPIYQDPVQFISAINQNLYRVFGELLIYITAIYMVLDLKNYTLELVNAGHTPAVIYNFYPYEPIHKLPSQNKMIGIFKDHNYRKVSKKLSKKDRIFLYTDGVFDIVNQQKQNLTLKTIETFINKQRTKEIEAFIPNLENFFYEYSGKKNDFEDDINLLIIYLN